MTSAVLSSTQGTYMKSKILGGLVGLLAVAGIAFSANTFYAGYNPNTNQFGLNGIQVNGGTQPTFTGSSCGTIGTVSGGTGGGEFITAAVTSCTITLNLPVPAIVVSGGAPGAAVPTRLRCTLRDLTHPAAQAVYSAIPTTTTCAFATQTITAGDTLAYTIEGY